MLLMCAVILGSGFELHTAMVADEEHLDHLSRRLQVIGDRPGVDVSRCRDAPNTVAVD